MGVRGCRGPRKGAILALKGGSNPGGKGGSKGGVEGLEKGAF